MSRVLVVDDNPDILQETTRKSDAVGRWGGEEFVVITPETTLEAAEN